MDKVARIVELDGDACCSSPEYLGNEPEVGYTLDMTPTATKPTCPVERTLAVIGDRWTILILRNFFNSDAVRFQDLEKSLQIAPKTLSDRLKKLEENGIIERRFYQQNPPRAEYLLTKKGCTLEPILAALYKWGKKNG